MIHGRLSSLTIFPIALMTALPAPVRTLSARRLTFGVFKPAICMASLILRRSSGGTWPLIFDSFQSCHLISAVKAPSSPTTKNMMSTGQKTHAARGEKNPDARVALTNSPIVTQPDGSEALATFTTPPWPDAPGNDPDQLVGAHFVLGLFRLPSALTQCSTASVTSSTNASIGFFLFRFSPANPFIDYEWGGLNAAPSLLGCIGSQTPSGSGFDSENGSMDAERAVPEPVAVSKTRHFRADLTLSETPEHVIPRLRRNQ